MAKNDISLQDIIDMLADAVAERLQGTSTGVVDTPAPSKTKASKSKAAEPETDEDDDVDPELADRIAELMKIDIRNLRKQALALQFEEDDVKDASKKELAENIAEAELDSDDVDEDDDVDDDEEVESEEDDEDIDEDEEDEVDEDDEDDPAAELQAMSLTELKKQLKDVGYTAADLKGLDKDALIEMILEDEPEEDDDEVEDEDEEADFTEEDLEEMSLAELKALCKDFGIKIPRGAKEDDLIELLMEEDE